MIVVASVVDWYGFHGTYCGWLSAWILIIHVCSGLDPAREHVIFRFDPVGILAWAQGIGPDNNSCMSSHELLLQQRLTSASCYSSSMCSGFGQQEAQCNFPEFALIWSSCHGPLGLVQAQFLHEVAMNFSCATASSSASVKSDRFTPNSKDVSWFWMDVSCQSASLKAFRDDQSLMNRREFTDAVNALTSLCVLENIKLDSVEDGFFATSVALREVQERKYLMPSLSVKEYQQKDMVCFVLRAVFASVLKPLSFELELEDSIEIDCEIKSKDLVDNVD
ncbi:hypothetical protein Tco_0831742 [Tanacetum coccineum]